MSWLLVAPILVPLATAVLTALLWRHAGARSAAGVAGSAVHLAAAVLLASHVFGGDILAGEMGGWPTPFGISLVADHLGASMVVITALMGLAVGVYGVSEVGIERERHGFHPLYHVLLTGVTGAFLTGDLFNLYVWFEVMLMASFALLALGSEKAQLDGAIKYAAINLVATVMFLLAVGILYGLAGTLNMADLALRLPEIEQQGLVTTVAMLFLAAFGIKSAVFPLFFWLPASYHTPAVTVSAIFAGLLTKVGVYALIRVFTLVFTGDVGYTHDILLVVAGLTMVTGVLGAAAQNEIRRILSFHIVSQIGYMIMGLALYTPLAVAGAVFYVVHHIIVKTNLFLVAGLVRRLTGSMDLKLMGGVYAASPMVSILFLVPAFSLAGMPPLSGFWAKLILIRASLEAGAYVIAATAIVVGVLTLYSMTKIWGEVFWTPGPPESDPPSPARLPMAERLLLIGPIAALAAITLTIGIWTQPFLDLADRAAGELLAPAAYIEAVLGGRR
jgi:multicomponent Na+:H+ antiporter subunit D